MRRCSKCKETKPLTTDYFSESRAGRKGFKAFCKDCQKKYNQAYYKRKKEKILKQQASRRQRIKLKQRAKQEEADHGEKMG